jgi:hypothetical protein
MLAPEGFCLLATVVAVPVSGLLAYVGFGPGQEFIPQFMALLAVMGSALFAILQWPFVALLRRFWRAKSFPVRAAEQMLPIPTEAEKQGEQHLDTP